jgi:hypothetical protein
MGVLSYKSKQLTDALDMLQIFEGVVESVRDRGHMPEDAANAMLARSRKIRCVDDECRAHPFTLHASFDTDDDAEIIFDGESYCHYGPYLDISLGFNTREEAYAYLREEIKITPGFKCSEVLAQWIEEFIACDKAGEDWDGVHGNQKIDIRIQERK